MDYKVDYHIHTKCSDGGMTPTQIVKKYKDEEYDIIAITDHDGVDGITEAKIAGEALEIKVVPGIELSAITDDGINIHILGYDMDIENKELKDTLSDLKKWRKERNIELINKLTEMGYAVNIDEIYADKGNEYIGKPDIARNLIKNGMVNEMKEAFEIYSEEAIEEITRKKLNSKKAIEVIDKAGGIAVMAHPMKTKGLGVKSSEEFFEKMDKIIRSLKLQGLKGLECYHPSADEEDSKRLLNFAEKYHLHITEGSDFHGEK